MQSSTDSLFTALLASLQRQVHNGWRRDPDAMLDYNASTRTIRGLVSTVDGNPLWYRFSIDWETLTTDQVDAVAFDLLADLERAISIHQQAVE